MPFFRVLVTIEPHRSLLTVRQRELFDKERVKERWAEDFENVLNRNRDAEEDIEEN